MNITVKRFDIKRNLGVPYIVTRAKFRRIPCARELDVLQQEDIDRAINKANQNIKGRGFYSAV